MLIIAYTLFLLAQLIFLIGFTVVIGYLFVSNIMGAPYVPIKGKEVDAILDELRPKRNALMIELGSGDGRFLRRAVARYGVRGIGYDINHLLLILSRLYARFGKLAGVRFVNGNILDVHFKDASYVYFFLMPKLIDRVKHRMRRELGKHAVVVSHGFRVEGWERYLVKTIHHSPFPTYFYAPGLTKRG